MHDRTQLSQAGLCVNLFDHNYFERQCSGINMNITLIYFPSSYYIVELSHFTKHKISETRDFYVLGYVASLADVPVAATPGDPGTGFVPTAKS